MDMGKAKIVLRGLLRLLFALVSLLFVCSLWNIWRIKTYVPDGKPMFTETSPSQRFTVFAYPSPTIYMPVMSIGGGNDGPALFVLRDNLTGEELQREHVSGPWWVYTDVYWCWDKNHVHLAAGDGITWPLPTSECAK
jgi:hypothetical protein